MPRLIPPGFGTRCEKAIDPLCQKRCFQCCQRGNGSLPETNYLRCKNPQHPPYQESELAKQWKQIQEKIKESLWQYPYATVNINMYRFYIMRWKQQENEAKHLKVALNQFMQKSKTFYQRLDNLLARWEEISQEFG